MIKVILYVNIRRLKDDSNGFMSRNNIWIGRYKTIKRYTYQVIENLPVVFPRKIIRNQKFSLIRRRLITTPITVDSFLWLERVNQNNQQRNNLHSIFLCTGKGTEKAKIICMSRLKPSQTEGMIKCLKAFLNFGAISTILISIVQYQITDFSADNF